MDALRPHCVRGTGQRQEVSKLGGVQHVVEAEADGASVVEVHGLQGDDPAPVYHRLYGPGAHEDAEPAGLDLGRQEGVQRAEGGRGLEGQARDPAAARIQGLMPVSLGDEPPVLVPDGLAQPVVGPRAAEPLDVLMLVQRGDALGGGLSAEPVGLLQKAYAPSMSCGCPSRRHSAETASDDEDVALDVGGPYRAVDADHCGERVA